MIEDPINDTTVTARVRFVGVMLGCINRDDPERDRFEVGMIVCPEHSPRIRITEQGNTKDLAWPAGRDLLFKVVNPVKPGVSKHLPNPDDLHVSFDLVVDLEGPSLHADGIDVKTKSFDGRRIGVTAGMLYAHKLTEEVNLNTWSEEGDVGTLVRPFGRIADNIGLNIHCEDGPESGILILDAQSGDTLHWLPAQSGPFAIGVNNDCNRTISVPRRPTPRPAATPSGAPGAVAGPPVVPALQGSDFREVYKTITPKNAADKKFDFSRPPAAAGPPRPSPDICIGGTGGRTNSIGFKWPA